MSESRFTPEQEAAMEAMERRELAEATPTGSVAQRPTSPLPAAVSRGASRSTVKAAESPVGVLISSVVGTFVGAAMLGVGSTGDEFVALSIIGALLVGVFGVTASAAVIAIGVRWGMTLHEQDHG